MLVVQSAQEFNMDLVLPPHIKKLIEDRVASGRYQTPEDVLAAALTQLDAHEQTGDFQPNELDTLLEQGEASGMPLDGDEVFAELNALRRSRPSKAG
jgi:putative addiction module CopG family antidote